MKHENKYIQAKLSLKQVCFEVGFEHQLATSIIQSRYKIKNRPVTAAIMNKIRANDWKKITRVKIHTFLT